MMYTFKCKAAGNVLMAGSVGDQMLSGMGVAVSAKGILQPGDMPAAIRALELAVAEDESRRHKVESGSGASDAQDEAEDAVTLRQHAWPLIELLKQAHAADEAMVWGV